MEMEIEMYWNISPPLDFEYLILRLGNFRLYCKFSFSRWLGPARTVPWRKMSTTTTRSSPTGPCTFIRSSPIHLLIHHFHLVCFTKMAHYGTAPPNLDPLSLSDKDADDTEDLFASPSLPSGKSKPTARPEPPMTQPPALSPDTEEDSLATHEASLRRELSSIRTMNRVISGIVDSLEKAKGNMQTVSATVSNASGLLTTWTRILSQTEHNQRLILNPQWQGASQDIADGENEIVLRRQEKERRDAEEVRREEARVRKLEDAERRRMTEGPANKGSRGRGRGVGAGTAAGRGVGRGGGGGYVGVGGQGGVRGTARGFGTTPGRVGSGVGRGTMGPRGRGRGAS